MGVYFRGLGFRVDGVRNQGYLIGLLILAESYFWGVYIKSSKPSYVLQGP